MKGLTVTTQWRTIRILNKLIMGIDNCNRLGSVARSAIFAMAVFSAGCSGPVQTQPFSIPSDATNVCDPKEGDAACRQMFIDVCESGCVAKEQGQFVVDFDGGSGCEESMIGTTNKGRLLGIIARDLDKINPACKSKCTNGEDYLHSASATLKNCL